MLEVSSYLLSKESNTVKVMLEVVDTVTNVKSNYYYEIVISNKDFKILSIEPISDLLKYLFDMGNIDLNSRKMDGDFTYKLFEIVNDGFINKNNIKITIDDNVKIRNKYYNKKINNGKYSVNNDYNIEVYKKNREILKEILESRSSKIK
jgi:hypothetical protein